MFFAVNSACAMSGENLFSGFSEQVRQKRGCKPQKMIGGLEFQIKIVEGLYDLYSENKGTDQHGRVT